MMMHLLFLVVATLVSLAPNVEGFSSVAGRISTKIPAHSTSVEQTVAGPSLTGSTSFRLYSTDDKQAEIAALEERLRQLKEDESSPVADEPQPTPELSAEELVDYEAMEGESDDSIMFSERWKEAKDGYVTKQEEKAMGGLANVGIALAFVVFLGIFSQIPVGEESLQKYQDVKGNPSRIDLGDLNPTQ